MAILGLGNYRCEACRNFNADGIDGNSSFCIYQLGAKRVTDECGMFELGTPCGYEVTYKYRAERARKIAEMLDEREGL